MHGKIRISEYSKGRKNSFPVEFLMNCLLVTSRKPHPTGPLEIFSLIQMCVKGDFHSDRDFPKNFFPGFRTFMVSFETKKKKFFFG